MPANLVRLNSAENAKMAEEHIYEQCLEYGRQQDLALEVVKEALKNNNDQQPLRDREKYLQQDTDIAMNKMQEAHLSWIAAFRRNENTLPFGEALGNAQMDFTRLDSDANRLVADTQEAIEKQTSETRRKFNFWRAFVWIVFGCGWLLNLVGVVLKIEGLQVDLK